MKMISHESGSGASATTFANNDGKCFTNIVSS